MPKQKKSEFSKLSIRIPKSQTITKQPKTPDFSKQKEKIHKGSPQASKKTKHLSFQSIPNKKKHQTAQTLWFYEKNRKQSKNIPRHLPTKQKSRVFKVHEQLHQKIEKKKSPNKANRCCCKKAQTIPKDPHEAPNETKILSFQNAPRDSPRNSKKS